MTTFDYLHRIVLPAAYALLPSQCASWSATAMLLAIALQESAARARRQFGGPARGFWQFEPIGVEEVLRNPATSGRMARVLETLQVAPNVDACYAALEYNDILAACVARLNLWRLPETLPARGDADEGWRQYIRAWRPGKPHPQTWADHFARGWSAVETDRARPMRSERLADMMERGVDDE